MKTYRTMKEELLSTESEIKQYERGIAQDIRTIGENATVGKALGKGLSSIWEQGVEYGKSLLQNRKALLIIGGGVAAYFLISGMLGSGRRRVVHTTPEGNGGTVVVHDDDEPNFLMQLINVAVKTFVLALARRLLLEFLKEQEKSKAKEKEKDKAPKQAAYPN